MTKKEERKIEQMTVAQIKRKVVPLLKKNDVVKAGIFGSYARGEAKKKSDIDMLVKQKGRKSYFDLVGLQFELEKRLGKKVDLLTYDGLNPYLKERILQEEVRII
jgi:uncharacterized protein